MQIGKGFTEDETTRKRPGRYDIGVTDARGAFASVSPELDEDRWSALMTALHVGK